MKLFSDGSAAYNFAPLQDHRLESALGQIKRTDDSTVAAADERYALSDGHVSCALWQNARLLMLPARSKTARLLSRHFLSGVARRTFSISSEWPRLRCVRWRP